MIDVVLATDMAIHFDLLKSFNSAVEAKPNLNEWPERNLIYQMIVHLADIANPSRPFPLARGWAERVIKEFCEQVSWGHRGWCFGRCSLLSHAVVQQANILSHVPCCAG
jgi:hypothetical protein